VGLITGLGMVAKDDNIKMDTTKIGCEDVHCIEVAQYLIFWIHNNRESLDQLINHKLLKTL
jgi:hypothetical protein